MNLWWAFDEPSMNLRWTFYKCLFIAVMATTRWSMKASTSRKIGCLPWRRRSNWPRHGRPGFPKRIWTGNISKPSYSSKSPSLTLTRWWWALPLIWVCAAPASWIPLILQVSWTSSIILMNLGIGNVQFWLTLWQDSFVVIFDLKLIFPYSTKISEDSILPIEELRPVEEEVEDSRNDSSVVMVGKASLKWVKIHKWKWIYE